jgi:hypothetical protein
MEGVGLRLGASGCTALRERSRWDPLVPGAADQALARLGELAERAAEARGRYQLP